MEPESNPGHSGERHVHYDCATSTPNNKKHFLEVVLQILRKINLLDDGFIKRQLSHIGASSIFLQKAAFVVLFTLERRFLKIVSFKTNLSICVVSFVFLRGLH